MRKIDRKIYKQTSVKRDFLALINLEEIGDGMQDIKCNTSMGAVKYEGIKHFLSEQP